MIFNLNFPVNNLSLNIYKLNLVLFIIFFLLLLLILIFFLITFFFHRKYLKIIKSNFIENFYVEFILFVFPLIFIFIIFFYSTFILINFNNEFNSVFTIKIIGYQWKWYYNYINGLGKNINYFSNIFLSLKQIINFNYKNYSYLYQVDNNFVLPIKKKIRLIFSSNDVIHSWYVPSLFIKQDAIPGFLSVLYFQINKTGKYKGFCTELCGKNHSYMPILINAVSFLNYKKWIYSKLFEKLLIFKF